nr:hypothetical protein Iba_scaffold37464CG0010 [Ipomoea batatas]
MEPEILLFRKTSLLKFFIFLMKSSEELPFKRSLILLSIIEVKFESVDGIGP